jgi:hypothetical protein
VLFHYIQGKNLATLLHNSVNNALTLVVDSSNLCYIKESKRRLDASERLVVEIQVKKMCISFEDRDWWRALVNAAMNLWVP